MPHTLTELAIVLVLLVACADGAGAVIMAMRRLERVAFHTRATAEQLARYETHECHARWLHDDICGHLRTLRLRLEHEPSDDDIRSWLDSFEHEVRLRQLEETLNSGNVRIADALQPFLRSAARQGTRIAGIPSEHIASMRVDADLGRSLRHAASVLITNATQAQATWIVVDVRACPRDNRLVLSIEDHAGGFTLHAEHHGRSLDSLRSEHGADALTIERTDTGSRVHLTINRAVERCEATGTDGSAGRTRASRATTAR